ncbi:MAG: hypothetical protein HY701_04300 [Gemmatimonadetes bacterium]|nr:hypothetical protein [Gemmatimonadota bacterium]
MTTLSAPRLDDFSPDDRAMLERLAARMGLTAEGLLGLGIFQVQSHWPAWLEVNFRHSLVTYLRHAVLPPLAKEAMHVAVSVTNHCEY